MKKHKYGLAFLSVIPFVCLGSNALARDSVLPEGGVVPVVASVQTALVSPLLESQMTSSISRTADTGVRVSSAEVASASQNELQASEAVLLTSIIALLGLVGISRRGNGQDNTR